jgi:hypothetical protein
MLEPRRIAMITSYYSSVHWGILASMRGPENVSLDPRPSSSGTEQDVVEKVSRGSFLDFGSWSISEIAIDNDLKNE